MLIVHYSGLQTFLKNSFLGKFNLNLQKRNPQHGHFVKSARVTPTCSQGLSHLLDWEKAGTGPQEPGPHWSSAHGTPIPPLRSPISKKMIITTHHAKKN